MQPDLSALPDADSAHPAADTPPDDPLQTVRELVYADDLDAAADLLESVAHPMTEIWLDHLRAGGRERLMLQESLHRYADADPALAPLRDAVDARDYTTATKILQRLDHPMTVIWQRHLAAGGRQRLELQESLALHADDPRVQQVATLLEADRTSEAQTLLVAMQHPMTEIWLDHLRAGGHERLQTPDDDDATDSDSVMDARMRYIQAMMHGQPAATPAVNAAGEAVASAEAQPRTVVESLVVALPDADENLSVHHHRIALLDWTWVVLQRLLKARPGLATGVVIGLFLALMLALSPTGLGNLIGILLGLGLLVLVSGRVETDYFVEDERISRRFQVPRVQLGESNASLRTRLDFTGDIPPALTLPPSITALQLASEQPVQGNDTHVQAQIIARTVFLSLWAWGKIDVRQLEVQHQFLGRDRHADTVLIVVPGTGPVEGLVEQRLLSVLLEWGRGNRQLRVLEPWRAGPDIDTLLAQLLNRPAQLVQLAQQDGVQAGFMARGMFRGTGFTAEVLPTVAAEAHNLNVLMARIARYTPTLHHNVIVSAARYSHTMPAFGLRVIDG
jgi:hypothetical protein